MMKLIKTVALATATLSTGAAAEAPLPVLRPHPGFHHPQFAKLVEFGRSCPHHHPKGLKLKNALMRLEKPHSSVKGSWVDTVCQFLEAADEALNEYCENAPKDDQLCNGQVQALIKQLEEALQCPKGAQLLIPGKTSELTAKKLAFFRMQHAQEQRHAKVAAALLRLEQAMVKDSWVDTACQILENVNAVLKEYCQEAPQDDQLCNGQIQQLIEQIQAALQCNGVFLPELRPVEEVDTRAIFV